MWRRSANDAGTGCTARTAHARPPTARSSAPSVWMRARWYTAAVSRSMTSDSAEREACAGTEGAAAEKTDADMAAGGERSGRAPVQ